MSVFIAGGTGFIGRRLTRSLVAQGETVTVMDIAPQEGKFDDLGGKVPLEPALLGDSAHPLLVPLAPVRWWSDPLLRMTG